MPIIKDSCFLMIQRFLNIFYCWWNKPKDKPMCAICLKSISLLKNSYLSCGHDFHAACLKEWKLSPHNTNKDLCPICRQPTIM